MKKSIRLACFFSAAFIVSALSACGGDDNNGPTPQPQPKPDVQAACRPQGEFTYTGSASRVVAKNGQLAVVVVPSLPVSASKHRNMTAPNAPESSQVQQDSGAFTTLASSGEATACLGLEDGLVSEIGSVGTDVAIGRWNRAKDTDGNTYTSEQGVSYAVGTPLSLPSAPGTLACTMGPASMVAYGLGGGSGTLESASATLDLGKQTLNDLSLSMIFPGAKGNLTLTNPSSPLNAESTGDELFVQTVVVGHDASQPLVAVGYSSPSHEGIGGVVVLSCK